MEGKTMKAYCLGTPPAVPGVYSLVHKTTGHVYVGQTTDLSRRIREWRAALLSGFGHTNYEMDAAVKQFPNLDEWYFVVDQELPHATQQMLLEAEAAEIDRRRYIPSFTVLNIPKGQKIAQGARNAISSITIMNNGVQVGQNTVAKLLGRHPDTIRDKVRWLREQGIQLVEMADLTMDRRDILRKIQNE